MAKKKRFRRIKRPRSGKKPYFTKDTQRAIKEFCSTNDLTKRAKLYNDDIRPALEKLAENLIFVYGFHTQHSDVDGLKHNCVINLYENLHKFDDSRGSNAFSYFNVVAKNWLIIYSRKKKKIQNRMVYIDDSENLSSQDLYKIESYALAPDPDINIKNSEKFAVIQEVLNEIRSKVKNDMEKRCCEAICQIFNNVDQLDFLNKRAIFVYVRDISGLNSKQLSVCMSSIRKIYRDLVGPDKKYDIF